MKNISVLITALNVIEEMTEAYSAQALARACHMSYSGLQKLFRYAFCCGVSEYATKRRLSRAACFA